MHSPFNVVVSSIPQLPGNIPCPLFVLTGPLALLSRESCRIASRLSILFFQPALTVASMGSTLTLSSLADSWQLAAAATFTIFMSFGLASLFGRAFLKLEDYRDFMPVQLSVAFANTGGFPLLLMDALCKQDKINSDFSGDGAECLTSATAMIFIYLAIWKLLFFSWGFDAIGHHRSLELKLTGQPADADGPIGDIEDSFDLTAGASAQNGDNFGNDTEIRMNRSADAPVDMGQYEHVLATSAEVVTQEEARKGDMIGPKIQPTTGSGIPREKSPLLKQAIPPTTLSMNGNVADSSEGALNAKKATIESNMDSNRLASCGHHLIKLMLSANNLSVVVGIMIAAVPFLQNIIFTDPRGVLRPLGEAINTLGTPSVAVATIVMAGSLMQVSPVAGKMNGQGKWTRGRITMGVLHIACRLIVCPAVGFAVFWLLNTKTSILGSNHLMHFILLIEFAVPSGSIIIVSLNQLKMPATAGFMAQLYIIQYIVSMFTVSGWTAIALRMVYGE